MADVIILGTGPAGISASLYTARAGMETLALGKDGGALEKTERIENYYGFPQPVSGRELIQNGVAQAERLGVRVVRAEVLGISFDGTFSVQTEEEAFTAPQVILATGSSRKSPKIEGLKGYEGHGVSYCAVCDGFFYRKKEVAVLGEGDYALHEARELLPLASKVTVLTGGLAAKAAFPPEIEVITKKISALRGEETLKSVEFEDGAFLPVSGFFVAVGAAGSADLAKKLGAETEGPSIRTDRNGRTNIPGLYAAGDCTGGLLQIAKAVGDGAAAGISAIADHRKKRG